MAAAEAQRALGAYEDFLSEWEATYSIGAYTLSLQAVREATEAFPRAPEFWFLRAQTALAAHDTRGAADHLAKAAELLPTQSIGLPGSRARAVAECIPLLRGRIREKTVAGAPRDPWAWLDDPSILRKANPSFEDRMKRPLGRRQPLMPLVPARRETTDTDDVVGGALRGQLVRIELKRDSLDGLLGRDRGIRIEVDRTSLRDPNLKIERGNIRILDGSVVLAKPEVPAAKVHAGLSAPPMPPRPASPAPAPPPFSPAAPVAAPRPTIAFERAATVAGTAVAVLPGVEEAVRKTASTLGKAPAGSGNAAADKWAEWERRIAEIVESGKTTEALRQVDEAIAKFPQSSRLAEVRAEVLHRAGRAEEAAAQWLATYRKAKQSGADERAERAFAEARELARENGDLMMDLAGVAAATGAAGTAAAAAKLAADLYRRRNDRVRLHAVLRRIAEWAPGDQSAREELARMDREAGVAGGASAIPPPIAPRAEGYAPVAPPSTRPAREVGNAPANRPLSETERRKRARDLDPSAHAPPQKDGDPGFVLLFVSIVLLLIGMAGTPIPGIVGYLVTHAYVGAAAKKSPDKSHMTAKLARFLCVVSAVIGFARCS